MPTENRGVVKKRCHKNHVQSARGQPPLSQRYYAGRYGRVQFLDACVFFFLDYR